MSVQDLLNHAALQGSFDSSGFAGNADGNAFEMLRYMIDSLSAGVAHGFLPLLGFDPDGAADATISSNTTISGSGGIKRYRDLTINNGIVLTAETRFQIVVCRNLVFGNTSSQVRAALNPVNTTTFSLGGVGGVGVTDLYNNTYNAFAHPLLPDWAAGGGGGAGHSGYSDPGSAGSAFGGAALGLLMACLAGHRLTGGNGGNGATGGTAAAEGAGGSRGGAGATGSTGSGGGGGSGIGGGGGGGGHNVSNGTGSTVKLGGRGSGALWVIVTGTISGAAGLITSDGEAGTAASGNESAGGGGGGGLAGCTASAASATPTVRANGGAAGAGNGTESAGGAGGAGSTFYHVG